MRYACEARQRGDEVDRRDVELEQAVGQRGEAGEVAGREVPDALLLPHAVDEHGPPARGEPAHEEEPPVAAHVARAQVPHDAEHGREEGGDEAEALDGVDVAREGEDAEGGEHKERHVALPPHLLRHRGGRLAWRVEAPLAHLELPQCRLDDVVEEPGNLLQRQQRPSAQARALVGVELPNADVRTHRVPDEGLRHGDREDEREVREGRRSPQRVALVGEQRGPPLRQQEDCRHQQEEVQVPVRDVQPAALQQARPIPAGGLQRAQSL